MNRSINIPNSILPEIRPNRASQHRIMSDHTTVPVSAAPHPYYFTNSLYLPETQPFWPLKSIRFHPSVVCPP